MHLRTRPTFSVVTSCAYRIYYEWPLPGESHELRTELIPA
jgi:hypothetical protein